MLATKGEILKANLRSCNLENMSFEFSFSTGINLSFYAEQAGFHLTYVLPGLEICAFFTFTLKQRRIKCMTKEIQWDWYTRCTSQEYIIKCETMSLRFYL